MATLVLTDVTTWVHDHDFTTDSNQLSLSVEVDAQDSTTFGGGGWRARKPGLRSVEAELGGFWDSPPDAATFPNLGTADHAVTISPTGAEGAVAYAFAAGRFEYEQFGGEIGEMCPYALNLMGTDNVGLVRGQLAKAKGAASATGPLGSAINLGAGGTGKYVYATTHIFTAGTTVTIEVQSDDAQGFASPTTAATIGPLTAAGGTFMTRVDAAAITDTWWRLNISAITGTFTVAGALAVQ
ncbi:MAG: hypothetical protein ACRDRZ_03635 [Pseudonocardiaceae bacterium]